MQFHVDIRNRRSPAGIAIRAEIRQGQVNGTQNNDSLYHLNNVTIKTQLMGNCTSVNLTDGLAHAVLASPIRSKITGGTRAVNKNSGSGAV
jgi:hypothetical protein